MLGHGYHESQEERAMTRLATAVIMQAVNDARSQGRVSRKDMDDAVYFFKDSEMLEFWCSLAKISKKKAMAGMFRADGKVKHV